MLDDHRDPRGAGGNGLTPGVHSALSKEYP
jgi:hypothetical protein